MSFSEARAIPTSMRRQRVPPVADAAVETMETRARRAPRRIPSPTLFDGDREVVIVHEGQEYRLRITRSDKLILTK
jgi:hemin uptake protein HemP